MNTRKTSIAFPVIATIRKGGPKQKKTNAQGRQIETVGADLQDHFRVVFAPGAEDVAAVWDSIYKTREPKRIRAMVPFPSIRQGWDYYNEAYNAGRMIARADDTHYLVKRDPLTGEYLVRDGEPFTKFTPGEVITYQRDGKTYELKLKATGRLHLWLPELQRMVMVELKTTSYYDCQNITQQLGAIEAIANALNGGNCAGVPFYIYRKQQSITWNKPGGAAQRVDKWLIQVEVDPAFVQAAMQRMSDFALTGGTSIGALPAPSIEAIIDPDDEDEEYDEDVIDNDDIPTPAPAPAYVPPEPEPAPAPVRQAPAQAPLKKSRPLSPEDLADSLRRKALTYSNRNAAQNQINLCASMLTKCFAGIPNPDKVRHQVTEYLTGYASVKDMPTNYVLALLDWLKPIKDSGGDYLPDEMAVREASSVYPEAQRAAGQTELF